MATADDLWRIALAMGGAAEAPHVDRAAFRVVRIFATLAADGRNANLELVPEDQAMLGGMAPAAFAPVPGRWGAQGWTTVTLAKIRVPLLRGAPATASRHARPGAPKRRPRGTR